LHKILQSIASLIVIIPKIKLTKLKLEFLKFKFKCEKGRQKYGRKFYYITQVRIFWCSAQVSF